MSSIVNPNSAMSILHDGMCALEESTIIIIIITTTTTTTTTTLTVILYSELVMQIRYNPVAPVMRA